MMQASLTRGDAAALWIPRTASYVDIEGSIATDGMSADIRRYGWRDHSESKLDQDIYLLDYALTRRPPETQFLLPGRRYYTSPGELVFLAPSREIVTKVEPGEYVSLCVAVHRDRASRILGEHELPFRDELPCLDLRSPVLEWHLRRLIEEIRRPGFASDVLVESTVATLFVELYRHVHDHGAAVCRSGGKLPVWRMKRLKEVIEARLGGTLSISALAAESGISRRHLVRTFKNTEGVTLSDYIAHTRLRHAKNLLIGSDMMIKEIAGCCGFGSAAAFSAAFRKVANQTPKEFRDQSGRDATGRKGKG